MLRYFSNDWGLIEVENTACKHDRCRKLINSGVVFKDHSAVNHWLVLQHVFYCINQKVHSYIIMPSNNNILAHCSASTSTQPPGRMVAQDCNHWHACPVTGLQSQHQSVPKSQNQKTWKKASWTDEYCLTIKYNSHLWQLRPCLLNPSLDFAVTEDAAPKPDLWSPQTAMLMNNIILIF